MPDDYFAGHPADSDEARRALELHHAIALELAADHDMEKVKSYRDELEKIRTAGARVALEAAGITADETTIGVLAGRIARGETTVAAIADQLERTQP